MTTEILLVDGMGKDASLEDWYSLGHIFTGLKNKAISTSTGIDREQCLIGHTHGWGIELLKHDLGHFLTLNYAEDTLGKQNREFFWGHPQLIVGVLPDLQQT